MVHSFKCYKCPDCPAVFNDQNQLKMHTQTHLPRTVECPLCFSLFRSSANVLQHMESGYCSGALGKEVAREYIYQEADTLFGLHYTDGHILYDAPEFPYECPCCHQTFRHGSQSLQHQEHKHGPNPFSLSQSYSDDDSSDSS